MHLTQAGYSKYLKGVKACVLLMEHDEVIEKITEWLMSKYQRALRVIRRGMDIALAQLGSVEDLILGRVSQNQSVQQRCGRLI